MARKGLKGGGGFGRPHLLVAAAVAQLGLAGCYTHTRVEPGAVPVGSDIRIRVSRDVTLSAGVIPLDGGSTVRGRVTQAPSADTLFCDVLLDAPSGAPRRDMRSTVPVPVHAVQEVEIRSLDRTRTSALVLAGTVLAWIVVDASFHISNPDPGPVGPPGGGDNARRIPILRWSF